MGCVASSEKTQHPNTGENWLNRPNEGYHWEQNKTNNSDSKTNGRNLSANMNERDATGVEGYVAADQYGGVDAMGGGAAAGCGAGGCGGCGGCGA